MKKSSYLIVIIFILFFGTFTLISIFKPQQSFSDNENRLLQQRPSFIWDEVLSGKFGEDYENYLADQFAGRDYWIRIKTFVEQLRGMQEINGVYFGKDDYLIEKINSNFYNGEQAQKNIDYLNDFINKISMDASVITHEVMFVPTAEAVLTDKLPSHVSIFDQFQWIKNTEIPVVDLQNNFKAENEESKQLYYRTDHHWTTYGAYIAYTQWMNAVGLEPIPIEQFDVKTISDEFYGTLHSKVNTNITPDTIEIYNIKDSKQQIYIEADGQEISLYDENKLNTKDQYGYFLGGNYGVVKIENNHPTQANRNLLIIKDSYANCFVHFALQHFNKTIMIDLRHTNQSVLEMISTEEITDILVLYSTDNFVSDRNIFKLNR